MSEPQRLRKERTDKLTRIMLEVIYRSDTGIEPAAEIINKAVVNFANYATQFDQVAKAQVLLPGYAEKCLKNYYDHYAERAMLGYDDDQELVDAICVAHDAMPALFPAAFAACIEQEEREVLAQSIELELQRAKRQKEQEELERLQAEQEERERIEAELREAERLQANQPPQANAADISRLMIDRMAELAETPQLDNELSDSLKSSLRSCANAAKAWSGNRR